MVFSYKNARAQMSSQRKLNFRQVKQVGNLIKKNKRIKNTYVPINNPFSNLAGDMTGATGIASFDELTVLARANDSHSRSEDSIQLQSYNLKLGLHTHEWDVASGATGLSFDTCPYRMIIVRSKRGPVSDILDTAGASIVDFVAQPDPDDYQVYTDEIHTVSNGNNASQNSYLLKVYKSFKKKKIPHMIVGYNDANSGENFAINNPIYMKIIVDPARVSLISGADQVAFDMTGFCHLKYFDKE